MVRRDITFHLANGQPLKGVLSRPEKAKGIIIFAHGSGSSHLSPRNQYTSSVLNESGYTTVLSDLLTASEAILDEKTREHRFNIGLLTERLALVTRQIIELLEDNTLPLGYFGASTGTAAALAGAIRQPRLKAIVSRGGRPDLAGSANLANVTAATLFLVGSSDVQSIELNQKAFKQLGKAQTKRLVIVPGAGHLFEEKGTLEEASKHAASWFESYLR